MYMYGINLAGGPVLTVLHNGVTVTLYAFVHLNVHGLRTTYLYMYMYMYNIIAIVQLS